MEPEIIGRGCSWMGQKVPCSEAFHKAIEALGPMLWPLVVFSLAISIFYIICMWRINTKAGQPGWAAIVPIYNMVIQCRVGQMSAWWVLALCVPFVNIVVIIVLLHRISRAFGHGVGFTIGLFLLGFIFWPILAFGNDTYRKLEN